MQIKIKIFINDNNKAGLQQTENQMKNIAARIRTDSPSLESQMNPALPVGMNQ